MKYLFAVCAFFITGIMHAQEQQSFWKGMKFQSINMGGILVGESGVVGQYQTINGFRKKQWFAGVGLGVDHYFERTVPVSLSLRKHFFRGKNAPFAYGDGSYHVAWVKEAMPFESDHKSGFGYELGAGYSFRISKSASIDLSAGYSYKPFSKVVNTMPWSSVWPIPKNALRQYDYQLRRISVKAGISL